MCLKFYIFFLKWCEHTDYILNKKEESKRSKMKKESERISKNIRHSCLLEIIYKEL